MNMPTQAEPDASATHLPVLDGLRGLAILLVLASHCGSGLFGARSLYTNTDGWPHSFDLPRWADLIISMGYHGVTLFFVVSAFTLTRQATRGGQSPLWDYGLRRVMRIGPGFWVAAIVYAILIGVGSRLSAPNGLTAADYIAGATFTGWLASAAAVEIVPGGWSVQDEVIFYTILPLLAWAIQGRWWRSIAFTIPAIIVVQATARYAMVHGNWTYNSYAAPFSQLPVFLLGMTAAYVMPYGTRIRRQARFVALLCLGGGIFAVPFSPVLQWSLLAHLQFAGLAAAATFCAAWNPPRLLVSALLVRLGTLSYSMYLFHFLLLWPMYSVASRFVPGNSIATLTAYFLLVTAGSVAVSMFTYRWVEQPPRRWMAARLRARQHARQDAVVPQIAVH